MKNFRQICLVVAGAGLLVAACLQAMAQPPAQTVIKGRISNAKGEPVAAASVHWMGTRIATQSDNNGWFSIPLAPGGRVLEISSVGYKSMTLDLRQQPGLLAQPAGLQITLQTALHELEEVVVSTGYEKLPKERATGSFEKLDSAALSLQPVPNIISRLNGMATGMLFDANPRRPAYTIRGISSIQGPTAPLIVLDNFPYEGDINNINPDDIASVTLLKDAAAASIWGARAGNGVIVITTRKAKQGSGVRGAVNINSSFQQAPDLFYSPLYVSAAEYVELERTLFAKGFYTAAENNRNKPALSPAVEWLIAYRDKKIDSSQLEAGLNGLKAVDFRQQFTNEFYQPSILQQYHASISAGSAHTSHYLSLGYNKQENELAATNNRFTLRSENNFRLGKKLELRAAFQWTQLDNETGKPEWGSISSANRKLPYFQLRDASGEPLSLAKTYRKLFTDTLGAGNLLSWDYLPAEDWKYSRKKISSRDINLNLDLSWQLLPWLQALVQYQYEWQYGNSSWLQTEDSYATREMINLFTQVNRTTGQVKYAVPRGAMLETIDNQLQVHNGRTQLQAHHQWGIHQLNMLAGVDIREAVTGSRQQLSYGYDPEVLTTGKVDYVTAQPNIITGFTQNIRDGQGYSSLTNRFVSWYANAGYQLKNRYLVSASLRKDASNLFGVKSNEKGVPLWSAGLGWIVSNESFFRKGWVNYLKLRFTTGVGGNVDQTKSAYTVLSFISSATSTNLPYARVIQFANPELRWEKMYTNNLGIDLKLLDRISLTAEVYLKKGRDLFGNKPLDATAGLQRETLTANVASMESKGIDISIESMNTKGSIEWSSKLLFSYNTNKVTDYYLGAALPGRSLVSSGVNISPSPGDRLYRIASYAWAGLDPQTGAPMGYINKQPSTDYSSIRGLGTTVDDIVDGGSAIPEYFGAFINSVSWRQLSLQISISYKLGYAYRRPALSYTTLFAGTEAHEEYYRRWMQPGDELHTQVPSLPYPANSQRDDFYLNSAVTVSKGDHIRLQFIDLSYHPFSNNSHPILRSWLFRFNAGNLGIIWQADKSRFDPDYPTQKPRPVYTLGTHINF